MEKVGIDDLVAYIPKLYLDAGDLEKERKLSTGHITNGLGIEKIAIPDAHEDSNTMAANAVYELLEQNNLSPKDIGRFEVATESSYDEAKAANSYIIGMLEQIYGEGACRHWGGTERKAACASAGYALYDMINWIRAKESDGKYGIVVATDIAKYEMGSSAEYTQGAGAVALLISISPRLLSFEPYAIGFATINERDFFRPFGKLTPEVDGKRSIVCYLYLMREALESWKRSVIKHGIISLRKDECILDYVDRICFHLPFPKIVEEAVAFLLRHEWRNLPRWREIIEKIGKEPPSEERESLEAILKDEGFMRVDKEFRKKFRETEMFRKFYEEKVEKSVRIGRQVGNAYTASLLLALDSLFETEYKLGNDLIGMRIGLGFYGSGATSLALSGKVQEGYKEVVRKFDVFEKLEKRKRISIEEYEELHEVRKEKRSISRFFYDTSGRKRKRREINESIIPPSNEFALIGIENNGYRVYKFVE